MDQFEVSECTLSGSSVGNITEDGVVASCHPPLPWDRNTKLEHIFKEKRSGVKHSVCKIQVQHLNRNTLISTL